MNETGFVIGLDMEEVTNLVLFAFLAIIAFGIMRLRNLFAVVMLSGAYSLITAGMFVVLDAVDVAFTEAAVGAGISTVLMLGTLALTKSQEKRPAHTPLLPLVVVMITGAVLIYGTMDMPHFGDPNAPAVTYLAPDFIEGSETEIEVPNIVTSVLASYRGFDTLGETGVIFTAGIAVMLLLGGRGAGRRRKYKSGQKGKDGEDAA